MDDAKMVGRLEWRPAGNRVGQDRLRRAAGIGVEAKDLAQIRLAGSRQQ